MQMETVVRARGQITLPAEVREQLNLTEGTRLGVRTDSDGTIILYRVASVPEADLAEFEKWKAAQAAADQNADGVDDVTASSAVELMTVTE